MGGFGIERVLYAEMLLLSVLASMDDIRTGKISNRIVFPFIAAGIITNIYLSGISGISHSLLGMATPFLLFIPLYAIGLFGAGDIKLFCALGSAGGPFFILQCMAFSFLAGGIIASIVMLLRNNFRSRFTYLLAYIRNCLLTLSIKSYKSPEDQNGGGGFPFAPAAAIGTLITIILQCLFQVRPFAV